MSAWNVKCLAHDSKIARGLSLKSSRPAKSGCRFSANAFAYLALQSNGQLFNVLGETTFHA
jgi:hypothetical protein